MFENIIGNEPIKDTLEQAIKNNKVSHSYLYLGTSGSISKKSGLLLLSNSTQDLHLLQCFFSSKHKTLFANSIAIIFFPIPDVPKYK